MAHLKIRVETRAGGVQVHLTSTGGEPVVDDQRLPPAHVDRGPPLDERQKQGFCAEPQADRAVLLVNARAHAEPDALRQIVLQAVRAAVGEATEVVVMRLRSFKPGRPNSTHHQ